MGTVLDRGGAEASMGHRVRYERGFFETDDNLWYLRAPESFVAARSF